MMRVQNNNNNNNRDEFKKLCHDHSVIIVIMHADLIWFDLMLQRMAHKILTIRIAPSSPIEHRGISQTFLIVDDDDDDDMIWKGWASKQMESMKMTKIIIGPIAF